jgi:indoleamine 2,3-dioxygenase
MDEGSPARRAGLDPDLQPAADRVAGAPAGDRCPAQLREGRENGTFMSRAGEARMRKRIGVPGGSDRVSEGSGSAAGGLVEQQSFEVDPERGFLPVPDPLERLPEPFSPWEEVAAWMPKLLAAGCLRREVERLPPLDPSPLEGAALRRAMMLLSYFGHGYVWETWTGKPANEIPACLAVPWYRAAERLGRPPVLSYASYALDNWRRLNPEGHIELGNLALLQNFLGGVDEEWFILIHVSIEAEAAPALAAIRRAQQAALEDKPGAVARQLARIATAMGRVYATLERMPERCDPYIYYSRVRPYIHGWDRNPVSYQGVAAYRGSPQRFHGETGAQSAIIPSLDAALGITHHADSLHAYLMQMRDYMPPRHRAFVEAIEQGPSIREHVLSRRETCPSLAEAYDACVEWVERFRSKHLEYASLYIHCQSERSAANPTEFGTGGTPFIPYLRKHRDETALHRVAAKPATGGPASLASRSDACSPETGPEAAPPSAAPR